MERHPQRINCDNHSEWLKSRGRGIGGSDAACILGLNPYKTNETLYLEKIGEKVPEDISNKPQVIYGKKAEEHIRALFALKHPELIVTYKEYEQLVDEEYDFIRASLDGEIEEIETGKKGVLEIKTCEILSSLSKENWKDQIPNNYYCQVLHYLGVTGYDFAILTAELRCKNSKGDYAITKEYRIERSEVQEQIDYLRQKEIEFWQENVLKGKKPKLIINLTNL